MSRSIRFNTLIRRLLALTSFFFGFSFGLLLWPDEDSTACTPAPTPIVSKTFYEHFQYRTENTCRNSKSSLFLTIGVLSSHERLLQYLPSMFDTWFLTADKQIEIILFIEENSTENEQILSRTFSFYKNRTGDHIETCIYIVKLRHVINQYPPQQKSFYAMKYLYGFYQRRTSWILRLDDNTFVNLPSLILWLKSIDSRKPLYIGQGGTGRVNGPPIHFPNGKYFCMGGSGVIISQQTLLLLGPWLDRCYQNETLTPHEDVELGRCILQHVGIDCTKAYDSKDLFHHEYTSSFDFDSNSSSMKIVRSLMVHPVMNEKNFRQLFAFFHGESKRKHFSSNKPINKTVGFKTFVPNVSLDVDRDSQIGKFDLRWKNVFERLTIYYIESLDKRWFESRRNWTIHRAQPIFGYYRFDPGKRFEIIIEILLELKLKISSKDIFRYARKRLFFSQALLESSALHYADVRKKNKIRRQFEQSNLYTLIEILNFREIKFDTTEDENRPLNLIVVAKDRDKSLRKLIKNYEREIGKNSKNQKNFILNIFYWPKNGDRSSTIENLPTFIRLVKLKENEFSFNRGRARQYAANFFSENDLIYFLDVDVDFEFRALNNIRNLILSESSSNRCCVVFPLILSKFSDEFKHESSSKFDSIFSIYGFGNVALRKRDLNRVNGWPTDNNDWGMEDVALFDRFVRLNGFCSVFRLVEPGFQHRYHQKKCNIIQDLDRRKMCLAAASNLIGSQLDLVNHLTHNLSMNFN